MSLKLSTRQIAYLRGLSQPLRPQLHIGYEGYTEGVRSALEDLLRGRELVKVRILNSSEEQPKELARKMAEAADCTLVGVIGRTFVLFRANPQLKERVELPPPGGR